MNNMGQIPADQWVPPWAQMKVFDPKSTIGVECTMLESYLDNMYQSKSENSCAKSNHINQRNNQYGTLTASNEKSGFEANVSVSPESEKLPSNLSSTGIRSTNKNISDAIQMKSDAEIQCTSDFSLDILGSIVPEISIKEEPGSLLNDVGTQSPGTSSSEWDTNHTPAHFDALKLVSEHLVERIKLEDVCHSGSGYPFCFAPTQSTAAYKHPFITSHRNVNTNSTPLPYSNSDNRNYSMLNGEQANNFSLNMNNNLMCTTMFLMNETLQQNSVHQAHASSRKHDIFNIGCEKGCNCEAANSLFRASSGLMFASDKHGAAKHFMTPVGPLQLTAQECGEFLLKKVAATNNVVGSELEHSNSQGSADNIIQRRDKHIATSLGLGLLSTENNMKIPSVSGQKYRVAKERPYSCSECGKTFLLKHHLVTHARVHTGERPHICTECGKSFAHKHCLNTHLLLHNSDRPFKCMECKKTFTLKHHLVTHSRVHSRDRPFVCQECGRTFPQKRHLVTHSKFHSGERPYVCEECGESFSQKEHLTSHSRFHGGQQPFVCPDCGITFLRKFELVNHGRLHGRQPFACEVCGKEFLQKRTLLAHSRLHTEGERAYICQHCGETFHRKAELTEHSSIHVSDKAFVCRECGNCFSNREGLALHYRLHASDRNFVADLCDLATAFQQPTTHFLCSSQTVLKSGNSSSSSSTITTTHMPKPKPHVCPDCGKCFAQKHGLTQHNRRHLGGGCDVRTHVCEKCGKAFFQKNHLILHERQHMERPPPPPPPSHSMHMPSSHPSHVTSSHPSQVPSSHSSQVSSTQSSQVSSSHSLQVPSSQSSHVSSAHSQVSASHSLQVPSSQPSHVPSAHSQVPSSHSLQVPSSQTSHIPSAHSQVSSSHLSQVSSSSLSLQIPSSHSSHQVKTYDVGTSTPDGDGEMG